MASASSHANQMSNTFAYLIKIVRNLSHNEANTKGRDNHKHFVEQQFKNSEARIDRAVSSSTNDLTKLIQLFDLILSRVERAHDSVECCIASLSTCKNLLQFKRAECHKLWHTSVEQKTLANLCDLITELGGVTDRCRLYYDHGYFFHASCLLGCSLDYFGRDATTGRYTLKLQAFIDDHGSALSESEEDFGTSDNEILIRLHNEILTAVDRMCHCLTLTMKRCLFSPQARYNHIVGFDGSSTIGEHSSLASTGDYSSLAPDHPIPLASNTTSSSLAVTTQGAGTQAGTSKARFALPEKLLLESDRPDIDNVQPYFRCSRQDQMQLILRATHRLPKKGGVKDMLEELFSSYEEELDIAAIVQAKAILSSKQSLIQKIGTSNALVQSKEAESVVMDAELSPQCEPAVISARSSEVASNASRSLSQLLLTLFENMEAVADRTKLVIQMSRQVTGEVVDDRLMYKAWASSQRALTAVLVVHTHSEIHGHTRSQSMQSNMNLKRHRLLASLSNVDRSRFNADDVVRWFTLYCVQNSSDELDDKLNELDDAFEQLTVRDIEAYFGGQSTSLDIWRNAELGGLSPAHASNLGFHLGKHQIFKAGTEKQIPQDNISIRSEDNANSTKSPNKFNTSSSADAIMEGRKRYLFKFERSAQAKSLSDYYKEEAKEPSEKELETQPGQGESSWAIGNFHADQVLVCTPSYRLTHLAYSTIDSICLLLNERRKLDCPVQPSEDSNTYDYRSVDLRDLIIFQTSVGQIIQNQFVKRLVEDLKGHLDETFMEAKSMELLPDAIQRQQNIPCPILWFSFMSMKAVDELVRVLLDISSHSSDFWAAIDIIIANHLQVCHNIFMECNSSTMEWINDKDVNRHLRSMPILQRMVECSSIMDDDQTSDLTSQHWSKKETDTLLRCVNREDMTTDACIITDYRKLRYLATVYSSLAWFADQCSKRIVIRKKLDDDISDNKQRVLRTIKKTRKVAGDIILFSFAEIRHHCTFHVQKLAKPENLAKYGMERSSPSAERISVKTLFGSLASPSKSVTSSKQTTGDRVDGNRPVSPGIRPNRAAFIDSRLHNFRTMNSAEKYFAWLGPWPSLKFVEVDVRVQSLARDLIRLYDAFCPALSVVKSFILFDGLGSFLASLLINIVPVFDQISTLGLCRMLKNIEHVYNTLFILQSRLLQLIFEQTFKSDKLALDDRGSLGSEDRTPDIRHFKSNTSVREPSMRVDSNELYRAVNFYGLVAAAESVDDMVEWVEGDPFGAIQSQYSLDEYKSLIRLKCRSTMQGRSDEQIASVQANAYDRLADCLDNSKTSL